MPSHFNTTPAALWEALPAAQRELLQVAVTVAREAGGSACLVGGPVRDLLLGATYLRDLDLLTTGDARTIAARFAQRTSGVVEKVTAFGTATVSLVTTGGGGGGGGAISLDFATMRTETYPHPGALPIVAFPAPTIEDDLKRRDFTINAMALPLMPMTPMTPIGFGALLDPFGGLSDLQSGRIRALHDLSFRDDPTRLFRGARYAARYGYKFETHTAQLAVTAVRDGYLDTVSPARKRREIELGMRERNNVGCFGQFHAHGLLQATSPALQWDGWVAGHIEHISRQSALHPQENPEANAAQWAAFVVREGAEAMTRLFADLAITEADVRAHIHDLVYAFVAWRMGEITAETPFSALAPHFEKLVVWIVREFFPEPMRARLDALYERWDEYRAASHLNGHDLLRLGVPRGPEMSQTVTALRAAWLDGVVRTPGDEKVFVRNRATSHSHRPSQNEGNAR